MTQSSVFFSVKFSSSPEVEMGSRFFGISCISPEDLLLFSFFFLNAGMMLMIFSLTGLLQFVMTEVFAGINHRLSEVYGNIELPNQDSKAR